MPAVCLSESFYHVGGVHQDLASSSTTLYYILTIAGWIGVTSVGSLPIFNRVPSSLRFSALLVKLRIELGDIARMTRLSITVVASKRQRRAPDLYNCAAAEEVAVAAQIAKCILRIVDIAGVDAMVATVGAGVLAC